MHKGPQASVNFVSLRQHTRIAQPQHDEFAN